MTHSTTIYLARHGEVHNPDEIMYGRLPNFHLSEVGRGQAAAAAKALKKQPLVALFSSPMQRAKETAAIIASEHNGLEVQTDERINEVHTPHDGRPLAELEAMQWDLYSGSPPEFEQPIDILSRTKAFFSHMRQDYTGQKVAAVAHGDVLVFMFLFACGAPIIGARKQVLTELGLSDEYPETASMFGFTYHTNDPDEVPEWTYLKPY